MLLNYWCHVPRVDIQEPSWEYMDNILVATGKVVR